MTNQEDAAGDGGVGEGGRGEGGNSGGGRSTTKPVSLKEPVGIKKNNQPIVVVTISRGVRMQQAIERQVREARQEREDCGGGRSMANTMTDEEGGTTMTGQTTINKQWGLRFAPFGQISINIQCVYLMSRQRRYKKEVGV
jgi:hypothetical protein